MLNVLSIKNIFSQAVIVTLTLLKYERKITYDSYVSVCTVV